MGVVWLLTLTSTVRVLDSGPLDDDGDEGKLLSGSSIFVPAILGTYLREHEGRLRPVINTHGGEVTDRSYAPPCSAVSGVNPPIVQYFDRRGDYLGQSGPQTALPHWRSAAPVVGDHPDLEAR